MNSSILNEAYKPFETNDQEFNTSAKKYRTEFLTRPVRRIFDVIGDLVTIRPGIRYAEKQYDIDADVQFGNYTTEEQVIEPEIGSRTLYTFFGSTPVLKFDPNKMYKTILGSSITKGEGLKNVEIVRLMLNILSGKLGNNLLKVIFSAKHVDGGKTSATLFNGYDTITATEIAGGGLSEANGNLYNFSEAITRNNCVDALKDFCDAADDFLMDKSHVNLIVPRSVYRDYLEDYKATTGAIPYNREYKKTSVEGHDNVFLRPMAQKKDSQFLHLTTKDNMLVGCNLVGEEEQIIVEKHHVVLLDFFATMFFGTDFKSIKSEDILVGKLFSE